LTEPPASQSLYVLCLVTRTPVSTFPADEIGRELGNTARQGSVRLAGIEPATVGLEVRCSVR
jgi:hypothetical protein